MLSLTFKVVNHLKNFFSLHLCTFKDAPFFRGHAVCLEKVDYLGEVTFRSDLLKLKTGSLQRNVSMYKYGYVILSTVQGLGQNLEF